MTPRFRRALSTGGAAFASVLLIAAVPLLGRGPRYPFVVSSASRGFVSAGFLGDEGAYGVMFHTKQQKNPWVEIDLGELRPVSSVRVRNRLDCCQDRAVPLLVEISDESRAFVEVARKDEAFDVWELELPSRPSARFVRLRAHASTILHLNEVEIR